tara:strand:- start:10 stop:123 length:114 start_codon:yes stop_codon:yes gene_type:complete
MVVFLSSTFTLLAAKNMVDAGRTATHSFVVSVIEELR